MVVKRFYSVVLLMFLSVLAFGQAHELYLVNIKARVVNIENEEPIPFAHIINHRVRGGTTTNADGFFSLQILTEDTLIIRSMGFVDYQFILPDFPPKDLYIIKVNPVRILLNEITVTDTYKLRKNLGLPESKPLDIPIELRGASFNEKPPLLAAFLNPISYLHYFLSDKEKEKREVLQMIHDDKQWSVFSAYHNLDNIKRLTGLDGREADNFMIYCNINNRLPYTASQMQIEFQILDFYFKYKKEQEKAKASVPD